MGSIQNPNPGNRLKKLIPVFLVVLNILILTPVAWIAGHLYEEDQQWKEDVEQRLDDISDLSHSCMKNYVTYDEFNPIIDRITDRLNSNRCP